MREDPDDMVDQRSTSGPEAAMPNTFDKTCANIRRNAVSTTVFILFAVASGTARADGYMAYSDFSSCPRNQIAETRREAGPFPSLAACQSYLSSVRQYNVCERRGCRPVGSSSGSGGSGNELIDKSSEAIAKGIVYGDAPTVGVGLMGLFGAALIQGAQSDPAAAERRAREAAIAAEQKRLAEEERLRQQELAKQRILGSLKGAEPSASLALKTEDPDLFSSHNGLKLKLGDAGNEKPKSDAYTKGFTDASGCFSQNAGPYCAGARPDQQQACLADYRAGFEVGDKRRAVVMQEAYQAGQQAGAGGVLANGVSDPRAEGSCRTQWIEAYNRGYFQGKHAKAQH